MGSSTDSALWSQGLVADSLPLSSTFFHTRQGLDCCTGLSGSLGGSLHLLLLLVGPSVVMSTARGHVQQSLLVLILCSCPLGNGSLQLKLNSLNFLPLQISNLPIFFWTEMEILNSVTSALVDSLWTPLPKHEMQGAGRTWRWVGLSWVLGACGLCSFLTLFTRPGSERLPEVPAWFTSDKHSLPRRNNSRVSTVSNRGQSPPCPPPPALCWCSAGCCWLFGLQEHTAGSCSYLSSRTPKSSSGLFSLVLLLVCTHIWDYLYSSATSYTWPY